MILNSSARRKDERSCSAKVSAAVACWEWPSWNNDSPNRIQSAAEREEWWFGRCFTFEAVGDATAGILST
jgi:hypothetical protein